MRPRWWEDFETFPNLEVFYDAAPDQERRRSGESDFGVWWWDGVQGYSAQFRVTCVEKTGEIIAVCERGWGGIGVRAVRDVPLGLVVVLGSVGPDAGYARSLLLLEGWEQVCGASDSLDWVVGHVRSLSPLPPLGGQLVDAAFAQTGVADVLRQTAVLLEALRPWSRLGEHERRLCVELTLALAKLPYAVAAPADPV